MRIDLIKLAVSGGVGYGVYKHQAGNPHQLRNGIVAGIATHVAYTAVQAALIYRNQKKAAKQVEQFINNAATNFNENAQRQQQMFDEAVRQHQQTVNHHNMLHQQMMNQTMMGM